MKINAGKTVTFELWFHSIKLLFMRTILYLIAVILVIGWVFGFYWGSAGNLIHILLVIAIIAVLLGIIRRS